MRVFYTLFRKYDKEILLQPQHFYVWCHDIRNDILSTFSTTWNKLLGTEIQKSLRPFPLRDTFNSSELNSTTEVVGFFSSHEGEKKYKTPISIICIRSRVHRSRQQGSTTRNVKNNSYKSLLFYLLQEMERPILL